MPSGNFTLLESVKYSTDPVKTGVIATIIRESAIAQHMSWMPIGGNAYKSTVEQTLPTVAFRQVNANYTASWGGDAEELWGTTILGGEVKIDNYIIRVRGDARSVKAAQFQKFAKAMALTLDKYVIDGTGTANDFKGYNALVTDNHGQLYKPNANGGALTLGGLDEAHDLLRTGSADHILLNRTVRRKITSLARNTSNSFSLIDTTTDAFGRQVMKWNDIPLSITGDGPDGSQILAFDETTGSSNVTTSLYFVRYGDDLVSGLAGFGGALEVRDFGEQQAGPYHMGRVEFYPGLAVFDKYALVRYQGITNA